MKQQRLFGSIPTKLLAVGMLLACVACSGQQPEAQHTDAPASQASSEELLAPGVSQTLAEHRSRTLADPEYDIELDVTSSENAKGKVHITFTRTVDAGDLVVDFRGELRAPPVVNGQRAKNYRTQDNHLIIPATYLVEGKNRVEADFTTPIGTDGAAILRYQDETDGREYLYTVLVPVSAHVLFPCFDQPDLKARVRMSVVAPEGWTVLGNAELNEKRAVEGGEEWSFQQTPPIPTYVISFAAGPWHAWQSSPEGKRPMTLYARQSIVDTVDAEEFIDLNRRTIEELESLLGTPYPYGKYDMLIAPAFPLGAMEHVGSVYYGERGVLFFERPSVSQKLFRSTIVSHELSHQWFGNLVTMKWFDDLWLKEGFSTYVAARLQERMNPASEAWKTFYISWKPAVYATEQTSATKALWQPLGNLNDAGGNYGPIVYNKAPSVLRQLSFMIGEDTFTKGLQSFLGKYAYEDATWQDLMRTMEEVSGQSLEQFGKQYFLRPGMAEVTTQLKESDGKISSLGIRQSPAGKLAGKSDDIWPMRLQVRLGYIDREDVLIPVILDSAQVEVPEAAGLPAPDYVWANDGDYGYGRFLLDAKSRKWVFANIGSLDDSLLRAQLWGTLWDEVRDTRLSPEEFVDVVLREIDAEHDEQVAGFILGMASKAMTHYLRPGDAADMRRRWEDSLLARSNDTRLDFGARKDTFDALVASTTTGAGISVLNEYLDGNRLFDGQPMPNPSRWSIVTRLLALDAPGSRARFEKQRASDESPQAGRFAFIAKAAINDPEVKDELFAAFLHDRELNQSWATSAFGVFLTPALSDDRAVRYLAPALERLRWIFENRSIAFMPTWIRGLVAKQHTREALNIVDAYLAKNPDLPQSIQSPLLEARDELERTALILESAQN